MSATVARVLFVDDEPHVVEALERMVTELEEDWTVACVTSGRAALEALDSEAFDVVVTDMRMPGMDGAAVLSEVHRRWPEALRVMLSGQTDPGAAMRSVGVAHQFLVKPCSAEAVVTTVRRVQNLHTRVASERVAALASGVARLPCTAAVYADLQRVAQDANADVDAVAAVLVSDPALAAKVLQIVNSGFFCRGRAVSDVRAAVVRLGIETVASLVVGAGAFDGVGPCDAGRHALVAEVRRRSTRAAAIARAIAPPALANDAFAAALLAGVGRLVFAAAAGEGIPAAGDADEVVASGTAHADVGAYLLGLWGLPASVVDAVAHHHTPRRDPRGLEGLAPIVHVADALAGDGAVDEGWFAEVGATARLEEWRARAAAVQEDAR